jgi:tetratricopeptide (TPR) repeat protein
LVNIAQPDRAQVPTITHRKGCATGERPHAIGMRESNGTTHSGLSDAGTDASASWLFRHAGWWVFAAAVLMGAPSLPGEFLAGDDIHLVRDHVLVNRPSLAHALALFDPEANRDLYQPVALLSFQMNFAVVQALGLTASAPGAVPGTWMFHLTNVLLHGGCAVLVWWLARRVIGGEVAALCVGVLFAIHPLNVATVAWLNGRMMLLSTLGALLVLVGSERLRNSHRWWGIVGILLAAGLCHLSKVRPMLPLLMLLPLLARRESWPPLRWWLAWGGVLLITGGCVALNLGLSATMVSEGDGALTGSPVARTVLAVAWYVQRLFVPVGLAPYHPAGPHVDWTSPGIPAALSTLLAMGIVLLVTARRTRWGWLGGLWFLLAIAVTLPLVTTRNQAVAERYMYLPLAGLLWPVATAIRAGSRRWPRRWRWAGGLFATGGLVAMSWFVTGFYRDDIARSGRIVERYGEYPRLRVMYGWSLYRAHRFADALAAGESALGDASQPGAPADLCAAWQLIGEARARLGQADAARAALTRAVAHDPGSALARMRLGKALARAGAAAAARAELEQAAELAPSNNRILHALAECHLANSDGPAARVAYERIVANNPRDPRAVTWLALDAFSQGDYARGLAALEALLAIFPEATGARSAAAWGYFLSGDIARSVAQVNAVLARDPADPTAGVVAVGHHVWQGDRPAAVTLTDGLLRAGVLQDPAHFDAFAAIQQRCAERDESDPLPYFLICKACVATGRNAAAELAAQECARRTQDPALRTALAALMGESQPGDD